mmetsp:Transcript_176708/g.566667  ORF Transcript_176708/g.566667 Transcript_176708/m.566667 type:complete len:219 (-) Transcript_176708:2845-3501(-)
MSMRRHSSTREARSTCMANHSACAAGCACFAICCKRNSWDKPSPPPSRKSIRPKLSARRSFERGSAIVVMKMSMKLGPTRTTSSPLRDTEMPPVSICLLRSSSARKSMSRMAGKYVFSTMITLAPRSFATGAMMFCRPPAEPAMLERDARSGLLPRDPLSTEKALTADTAVLKRLIDRFNVSAGFCGSSEVLSAKAAKAAKNLSWKACVPMVTRVAPG